MLKSAQFFRCVSLLVFFLIYGKTSAQQIYDHVFNPMKGMVSEVEKPFREELSLNGRWQFMPVYTKDISLFQKPGSFDWDAIPLKVPSPWNVNSFAEGNGGDFLTYPSYPKAWEKAAMGWMKKEFMLPKSWDNKQIKLHFEAIAGFAKIYINGQLAGENLDIFFPTEIDATPFLKNGKNELLVGIAKASLTDEQGKYGRRNYVAGSFWGQHIAGIWQDVSLIALPKLSISDVFVQPDVQKDQLTLAVSIENNTKKLRTFTIQAAVRGWEKPASQHVNIAPADNGILREEVLQMEGSGKVKLQAGESITVKLHTKVAGKLKNWTPDAPNLYGAVVRLQTSKTKAIDVCYTRFGWRQFTMEGTQLLLNGAPIVLKGDSWHFMGIPQMTRRYAWGWFRMLKDAHANAVRLHAQPFPSFYLDVADEMGICVLDETGIWSSDGGPKMDSDDYWDYCREHVKSLVMRDRNHPSIFGWSVCNETLPVALHVFHAPENIVQRQIDEINNWVNIVRALDPTRAWISGDGETSRPTTLPTVIGHYGDENSMKNWSSQGKPWGVGETGMGYYGTPRQVSKINGNRAYESQLGRMEGLAIEAYNLIQLQQKYGATYSSVFNIIWYGLKPLAFGLPDTTRPPLPEDGIFFPEFKEGIPGVQPERIGPYTSTINPGYDVDLPLYKPWPLFDAVQAANSSPMKAFNIHSDAPLEKTPIPEASVHTVGILPGNSPLLKDQWANLGVPFVKAVSGKELKMIVIDGTAPTLDQTDFKIIDNCLAHGGKVLVWNVTPQSIEKLNHILPYPLKLTDRKATSFIVKTDDTMLGMLNNKDFYFTEWIQKPVMKYGLSGEMVEKGNVLLEACNTDWSTWNSRPEYLKTAAVYRSELESKTDGAAMIRINSGNGQIYLSTLDLLALKGEGEELQKTLLKNLGISLRNVPVRNQQALSAEAELERALVLRESDISATAIEKMTNEQFSQLYESKRKPEMIKTNARGFLDIGKLKGLRREKDTVYLSFWLHSPRSLVNLLVEPDMPKLDLLVEGSQQVKVSVNGVLCSSERPVEHEKFENLPLEKGWNHVLIKLSCEKDVRHWKTKIQLTSNDQDFMSKLNSSVGQ
ncbi:glycoside hydrolase family 2 [Fulvivirga sp. M361]|uniref:glycoside hydrolase family 2 protein n=1 Tax=Fulvivirga sp. M361 TaxID=2594266 RepID=UPI00117BDA6D|nr:sugar-binding domain-containing protein [Fulvivirga sp. M361]TRX60169.1 glycoside hydrolase family 2 [Fulvivirga sp. M361]